ncbi:MAG: purine phosphorylase [Opitutales bacterium]
MKTRHVLAHCLCLSLVLVASLTAKPDRPYGPKQFPGDRPYTAIVMAYEPEVRAVLEAIEAHPEARIDDTLTFRGVKYRLGTYRDQPIVVFATGISIANAAMTTQMALDYFPIQRLLYMGIAGGVNPKWKPGDVIVPERWYYHDESVYANPDPEQPGQFIKPDYYESFLEGHAQRKQADPHQPDYTNFGYLHPEEVLIIKDGMDEPEVRAYFSVTPGLLAATREAVAGMPPQTIDERDVQISVGGNGITGSVFMDNRAYRQWAREVFQAEVTEMESAAVGQVCTINDTDWIIIRAVSDLAGGQEGKNDENVYDFPVSQIGARVLFALLDELAAVDANSP